MKKRKIIEGEEVSLLGIIVPADWDQNGKVVAYTLSTFDEKEYRIDQQDINPNIEDFLGEKVVINGTLLLKEHNQFLQVETIWPF